MVHRASRCVYKRLIIREEASGYRGKDNSQPFVWVSLILVELLTPTPVQLGGDR